MKYSSLIVAIFFLSCNRNNKQALENVVYYYPEKNIYYDSRQSMYYYSLDGAGTWDSLAYAQPESGTVLGPKIAIKRTENAVWINNASHRKEYKGILFNIINSQTILLSRADSISKLKPVLIVKPRPEVVVKESAPEKGLKKFFNKLFGKKKKGEDEKKQ